MILRDWSRSQAFKTVSNAVFALAIINFLVFFFVAMKIGGDALNGHMENGRYFLANHGVLTEVSRPVFEYSRIHAGSLIITHPLAILLGSLRAWADRAATS